MCRPEAESFLRCSASDRRLDDYVEANSRRAVDVSDLRSGVFSLELAGDDLDIRRGA